MSRMQPDLTLGQRAMMRAIVRREARRRGYRSGTDQEYWSPRVRELWRAVAKLPIWETPTRTAIQQTGEVTDLERTSNEEFYATLNSRPPDPVPESPNEAV